MKRVLLIPIFLFTSFSSFSSGNFLDQMSPIISRNLDETIHLEDVCKEVYKHWESLSEWKKRVEGKGCDKPKNRINKDGFCVIEITNCLPKTVLKYHGKSTFHDGPNCWNTALFFQNLVPSLRESSGSEFEFFMRSPFCFEIKDKSKLKPGDIGSIEAEKPDGTIEHIHSFIYLNEDLVFQKRGISTISMFELTSFEQMRIKYPLRLSGRCKEECEIDLPFDNLFPEDYVLSLRKRYPSYSLPNPSYFCPLFTSNPKVAHALFVQTLKKGFSISEEGVTEFNEIIKKGCDIFFDRQSRISAIQSSCDMLCPFPKQKYYRCEAPEVFFQRSSKKAKTLYLEVKAIFSPFEKIMGEHYSTNRYEKEDLIEKYRSTLQTLKKYVKEKKINLYDLSDRDKRIFKIFAIRALIIGDELESTYIFKDLMDPLYKLSQ